MVHQRNAHCHTVRRLRDRLHQLDIVQPVEQLLRTLRPDLQRRQRDGSTGHAETVNVYYDSSVITYPTLLKVYFAGQDPTQVNGQGPDEGTQYRSIAFYRNEKEKALIEQAINQLKTSGKFDKPIVVQVMPFVKFWTAEDYHQNYIKLNPDGGYVQNVSIPEIQHFQKLYPELIKPDHKF